MQKFEYKNSTVAYNSYGQGQAVVLLHGFGEDSTVWNQQLPALQNFKVIVPDLPGSGQSKLLAASNGQDIGMTDYADCIHALLQYEQVEQPLMFGHSMGGYITLAYAEKFGEEICGFGLLHSTAFADSDEKKESRAKGIKLIAEYGSYPFLKNTTPNLFAEAFKKSNPAQIETHIEAGKNFSPQALIQYYQAMIARPDRTNVLRNSQVPVLFILGSEDVAAPLDDLLQQVHLPSKAYVHVLENTGHMGMWEATSNFNKHLVDFITDMTC